MVCQVGAANLGAFHSVNPLWRGSHLRVPTHHHSNHQALPLHHHLSDPQKHVRRTRAARRFGSCRKENKLLCGFWIKSAGCSGNAKGLIELQEFVCDLNILN